MKKKIKTLLSKKIEWRKPSKVKTIVYGKFNSDFILEYTDRESSYVLDTDIINFYVAIRCITQFQFSSFNYICNYIRASKPKVIITSMDNDLYFWSLKKLFPKTTTILLQYAIHTELGDIFGHLKRDKPKEKFIIDHLFLFNENVKSKYFEYITGKAHIIGSFKSNHLEMDKFSCPDDNAIIFISQYRPEQKFHPVFFFDGDTPYYRDVFYESERALLPLLASYCKGRGIRLHICGHGSTAEEYHFFGELIGHYDFDFIPRIDSLDSYKTTYRSRIVVGVDSALAFEAFGRGQRVGFFPARFTSLKNDSFRMGWPVEMPESGPFWASYINDSEVERVLNLLVDSSDNKWGGIHKLYSDQLMAFDTNNSELKRVLEDINMFS